jgi:hypothetical protein
MTKNSIYKKNQLIRMTNNKWFRMKTILQFRMNKNKYFRMSKIILK